jgi:hypothetical protein
LLDGLHEAFHGAHAVAVEPPGAVGGGQELGSLDQLFPRVEREPA